MDPTTLLNLVAAGARRADLLGYTDLRHLRFHAIRSQGKWYADASIPLGLVTP